MIVIFVIPDEKVPVLDFDLNLELDDITDGTNKENDQPHCLDSDSSQDNDHKDVFEPEVPQETGMN